MYLTYIETSRLICTVHQLTGVYVSVVNIGLILVKASSAIEINQISLKLTINKFIKLTHFWSEAVIRRYSSKQVFLKFSHISQENTCVGVYFIFKAAGL